MKAGIHRFVPVVSTVRRSRDIPHVIREINIKKILVYATSLQTALPAGRCCPCLPSYSSP